MWRTLSKDWVARVVDAGCLLLWIPLFSPLLPPSLRGWIPSVNQAVALAGAIGVCLWQLGDLRSSGVSGA
jgi:hypothetical protein